MAERKLNLNAPLLSTRRLQTTAVSVRRTKKLSDDDFKRGECSQVSVCKPDTGLDQIVEPASVPFTWEQEPGRLKGDSLQPEACNSTEAFVPPPGKVMDILKSPSKKDFEGHDTVRTALDDSVIKLRSLKSKQVEESDDNDDDVFSDALDTLSPNESGSVNRSVSGVSGYGTETKKPLIIAEDPQSRDFMLKRFLPAAKAMTVEQPQYASKRQPSPLMSERTRQIRDIIPARQIREIVPAENCPTPNRYESIIQPHYLEDVDDDDERENDEESEYEEDGVSKFANSAYMSKRGCGLLPQLCFRNSIGMLKTVPGLKAKPEALIMSSHNQVKSSKVAQLKSRFQSVKKIALDSVNKQKLGVRALSPMHPDAAKKNTESEQLGQNLTAASRSSSPYRRSGCMSPYRSVGNSSPFHPMGFPGTRKEAENLRANRLNKHIKNITRSQELLYPKSTRPGCSISSATEKTVYVDTETSCITNDQQNSNVKISQGTVESMTPCVETEVDTHRNKPDAKFDAVESLSITSGKIEKMDDLEKIKCSDEPSPLAPPLPKKPSESWLFRNLSSVSTQIPSRRSPFRPQRKNLEEKSNAVTKWETIVKTSYMHRDHIRYSEELVGHQSKT